MLEPVNNVWWNTTNLFADLPLREYLVDRTAKEPGFLLSQTNHLEDDCFAYIGTNQVLGTAPCEASSTVKALASENKMASLWVYDATTGSFKLARDTSLCLDIFISQAGFSGMGVYWCHGGVNQRFLRTSPSAAPPPHGGALCALNNVFCVWPIAPSKKGGREGGALNRDETREAGASNKHEGRHAATEGDTMKDAAALAS
mmetsp:Transcript_30372/g.63896  ORF Transcript_30372/g.63896 Transcript_30372/m.63896 type:complete len:201 (-) Transcript_30372:294-896(-)